VLLVRLRYISPGMSLASREQRTSPPLSHVPLRSEPIAIALLFVPSFLLSLGPYRSFPIVHRVVGSRDLKHYTS